jgi:hypothetical protein
LDAFEESEAPDQDVPADQAATEQAFMLLSAAALSGSSHPHTLQLRGQLQGQDILILVDSRSSHSFISGKLASKFSDITQLTHPLSIKVADGNSIYCSSELSAAEWSIQGIRFHSNLRVIPLASYDMIAGMDWLQAFSPMKVDWADKWISIPYGSCLPARYCARAGLCVPSAAVPYCFVRIIFQFSAATSSSSHSVVD